MLVEIVDADVKKESNLHNTRETIPKCVTSGGTHLHCFAPGQHGSEEMMQKRRAVGDTLPDFTSSDFGADSDATTIQPAGKMQSG